MWSWTKSTVSRTLGRLKWLLFGEPGWWAPILVVLTILGVNIAFPWLASGPGYLFGIVLGMTLSVMLTAGTRLIVRRQFRKSQPGSCGYESDAFTLILKPHDGAMMMTAHNHLGEDSVPHIARILHSIAVEMDPELDPAKLRFRTAKMN